MNGRGIKILAFFGLFVAFTDANQDEGKKMENMTKYKKSRQTRFVLKGLKACKRKTGCNLYLSSMIRFLKFVKAKLTQS